MALDSLAHGQYDVAIIVNEPNVNRAFYLPRLPREYYRGDSVVHWTLPISHRRVGWLDERFHSVFRELVKHPREWPFSGAVVLGYPTLHPLQEDFWPKFWKLYAQAKHPDAGNIRRPPMR